MAIRACAAQQDCNRRPRRPVCSAPRPEVEHVQAMFARLAGKPGMQPAVAVTHDEVARSSQRRLIEAPAQEIQVACRNRSEEHTSELQSLMRISYAVFCLKKTKKNT